MLSVHVYSSVIIKVNLTFSCKGNSTEKHSHYEDTGKVVWGTWKQSQSWQTIWKGRTI